MNLRPFFEISKPKGGHRDWRRDGTVVNNLHKETQTTLFPLCPNLERLFSISDGSKELIQQEFRRDTIEVFDRTHGYVTSLS